ncbi:DUF6049 family protein [Yinghuangia sp. ASG 101]|uniref:DUF6049 family protein n=1 Tax=Yinghuangia sp. ASG 101 TaxID=2896848 RepID=UPI001E2C8EFE|nr:DUF6049 family protein [Yinghuangia sp. ASG 101]UGQ08885.1 DUF6049 family protein [Yinghuangia sp. ASG 101]
MTGVRGGARGAVGMVMLVMMLAATLVTAGVSRAAETAAGKPPVEVVVRSVAPSVLRPESDLTVRVEVVNNTGRDLDDVTLRMRIGADEMTVRDELSDDATTMRDVSETGATVRVPVVRAGQRESRDLKVPADKLGLNDDTAGVYALDVDAVDDGSRAATSRLLMPWIPEGTREVAKTRIGVLWPLIDQPRRDGTTLGDEGQTPVFLNDGLNTDLADGGRLQSLVDSGSSVPGVTWVVDPDLLDTASAMVGGYRVAPPKSAEDEAAEAKADAEAEAAAKDGKEGRKSDTETANAAPRTEEETEPGTGGATAAAWLERLRRAADGHTVVALPYADTDLAAVAHAGPLRSDLTAELGQATALGRDTAQRVLQRPVRADVAWPVMGAVDNPVLDTARANGSSLIVASGSSLQPRDPHLTYTPSTRLPLTDTTSAMVTDHRIDTLLAGGMNAPERRLEIQQALVSELFTIAMEQPQLQRSLLIALPRTADASLGQAVAGALKAVSGADGWSEMVSLDALAQTSAGEDRTMKVYPQELKRTEPAERYLKSIPQLQSSVAVFAGILSKPERITDPYDPAVLRTLSTVWRAETMDSDAYRLDVTRSLRVLQQLVRIAPKTSVTLSGETGQVPVTIINGLQQAITIKLSVESRQPNRLTLSPTEERTIPGGHTSAIAIDAKSAANGKVIVDVRILTRDDKPFGPTQTFYVNTTSIDGITLGIIGVIAGLLALFSLRAYLRRRRIAAAGEDEAGEGTDTDGGDGPGPFGSGPDTHGGNEGATTGQGSRDRPGDHHAPA